MSKIDKLWKRFSQIEAELEMLEKNSVSYEKKADELVALHQKIQQMEVSLSKWQLD